ncbi:DUF932 domain-containing protein [Rhodococcus hoagii]|nr:DUF932 domain-containing protein [Prescottella equi]
MRQHHGHCARPARDQHVKIRHSRHSGLRIDQARKALSVVEETADEFAETLRALTSRTVTDRQWFAFLDAWHPLPEDEGRSRSLRCGCETSWSRCTDTTRAPTRGAVLHSASCRR